MLASIVKLASITTLPSVPVVTFTKFVMLSTTISVLETTLRTEVLAPVLACINTSVGLTEIGLFRYTVFLLLTEVS